MGDRATIRVIQPWNDTPIHFYTHWAGGDIAPILAAGIIKAKAEGRLDDESYATRIVFDTLTGCDGGSTGFGIIVGDDAGWADINYDSPTLYWKDGIARVEYLGLDKPAEDFAAYWRETASA